MKLTIVVLFILSLVLVTGNSFAEPGVRYGVSGGPSIAMAGGSQTKTSPEYPFAKSIFGGPKTENGYVAKISDPAVDPSKEHINCCKVASAGNHKPCANSSMTSRKKGECC